MADNNAGAVSANIILIPYIGRRSAIDRPLLRALTASLQIISQEWFGRQLNAMSLSELKTSPIDARKAMVLSHIYFPLLRDACQVYVNACARFQTMLIDNHEFVEGVDAGTQAAHKNRVEFERVAEHLHLCRQRLEEEIIRHAHRYTKA